MASRSASETHQRTAVSSLQAITSIVRDARGAQRLLTAGPEPRGLPPEIVTPTVDSPREDLLLEEIYVDVALSAYDWDADNNEPEISDE